MLIRNIAPWALLIAGNIVTDSVIAFWWRSERGHHRVSNESRPLSSDTLYAVVLCSSDIGRESLSRAAVGGRDHQQRIRTVLNDGQVRSSPRKVHGLLYDVSRRRGPQGRELCCCHHKMQEDHPVRRLVSHGLQVRHQLPASDCGSRRRLGQSAACCLHDFQLDECCWGVFSDRPQIRSDVRQACFCALVRGRGHGGGRILRSPRGPCGFREGLWRSRLGFLPRCIWGRGWRLLIGGRRATPVCMSEPQDLHPDPSSISTLTHRNFAGAWVESECLSWVHLELSCLLVNLHRIESRQFSLFFHFLIPIFRLVTQRQILTFLNMFVSWSTRLVTSSTQNEQNSYADIARLMEYGNRVVFEWNQGSEVCSIEAEVIQYNRRFAIDTYYILFMSIWGQFEKFIKLLDKIRLSSYAL